MKEYDLLYHLQFFIGPRKGQSVSVSVYFLLVAFDIVDPYKDIGAEVALAAVPPLNNVM